MSQLTNNQKETVIKDFKEWTGGYVPSEVTEKKVAKYVRVAGALAAEFDNAVEEFLSSLSENGFNGENEFLKFYDRDNLLRLSEQARHAEKMHDNKMDVTKAITNVLAMFLQGEIQDAGTLDSNNDFIRHPTVKQFDEYVSRPDVLQDNSYASTHILRDLLILAESINYTF